MLLECGANMNYKDADGRSGLYILALENKADMVQHLLEWGAEVECTDLEGRTCLHVAAWQGHFKVTESLIKHGANVNAVDNDSRTALQSAAWQGHESIVQLLLENGASVDHTCNQGATGLCIAAQEGHEQVVKVLLHHKANPNHADRFGRTPVRVAIKSGHSKVCRILEEFGAILPGNKSRSNSSTSSTETKLIPANGGGVGVVVNGNTLNSSASDSPDSTFDRRKSYASNNSSKSSSNLTNSTNQSSQSANTTTTISNGDCLTFTQQLQQCSMARHRARPMSRMLSPVSEPQSPIQSPTLSPKDNIGHYTIDNPKSPVTERNLNMVGQSPVKFLHCKHKEITSTINIITNPNADLSDEPVWQINPVHFQSMKTNLEKLRLHQKALNYDQPIMGQSALEMNKSKRNCIVTNPKITPGMGVNSRQQKVADNGLYSQPQRPNGLTLKKETPL